MTQEWWQKNPEQSVVNAIDELVDHELAQPIVDDYNVNRYDKCETCGGDWHGLPVMLDWTERSCPGAWASDEVKNVWREMFTRRSGVSNSDGPSSWTLTNIGQQNIRNDLNYLDSTTFKIALFRSGSNIGQQSMLYDNIDGEVPNGGGYTTGGVQVSFVMTGTSAYVKAWFTTNPVWLATGRGFKARHALVYDTVSRQTLCYFCLNRAGDVCVTRNGTLTIDCDAGRPVFT